MSSQSSQSDSGLTALPDARSSALPTMFSATLPTLPEPANSQSIASLTNAGHDDTSKDTPDLLAQSGQLYAQAVASISPPILDGDAGPAAPIAGSVSSLELEEVRDAVEDSRPSLTSAPILRSEDDQVIEVGPTSTISDTSSTTKQPSAVKVSEPADQPTSIDAPTTTSSENDEYVNQTSDPATEGEYSADSNSSAVQEVDTTGLGSCKIPSDEASEEGIEASRDYRDTVELKSQLQDSREEIKVLSDRVSYLESTMKHGMDTINQGISMILSNIDDKLAAAAVVSAVIAAEAESNSAPKPAVEPSAKQHNSIPTSSSRSITAVKAMNASTGRYHYRCDLCSAAFPSFQNLQLHRAGPEHVPSSPSPLMSSYNTIRDYGRSSRPILGPPQQTAGSYRQATANQGISRKLAVTKPAAFQGNTRQAGHVSVQARELALRCLVCKVRWNTHTELLQHLAAEGHARAVPRAGTGGLPRKNHGGNGGNRAETKNGNAAEKSPKQGDKEEEKLIDI
jgi:hypothetical protein